MKLLMIRITAIMLVFLSVFSCKDDDDNTGVTSVEARERDEVYLKEKDTILTYLKTHTYNYEEFDFVNLSNPQNDVFEIVFDTITDTDKENGKESLYDRLYNSETNQNGELKLTKVTDPVDSNLVYDLYYLELRKGGGAPVYFSDAPKLTYQGSLMSNGTVFDERTNVRALNLTQLTSSVAGTITGFREGVLQFNAAENFMINNDGTVGYKNFGMGAVFVPSGLGYFSASRTSIPSYSPLIFKINIMTNVPQDHDGDGVPTYLEDINRNQNALDDDTDQDGISNFADVNDDNDTKNTKDEILIRRVTSNTIQGLKGQLGDNEQLISFYATSENTYEGEILKLINTSTGTTPDYLNADVVTPDN